MAEGLKHFVVVGLVFTLGLGWVASSVMTSVVAALLHGNGTEAVTDSYGAALSLTLISLGVILGVAVLGNGVFRSKIQSAELGALPLTISTMLFLVLVGTIVCVQTSAIVGPALSHLQYLNHHPEVQHDLIVALSLPLLRLVVLPSGYLISTLSANRGGQRQ